MIILKSIQQLLKFKKTATYIEIASVSKKSKIEVLECLNNNHDLLVIKGDKIIGFVNVDKQQKSVAFDNGLTFRISAINYGADNAIDCKSNLVQSLLQNYICGGIGDNWNIKTILATQENIDKVKNLGIIEEKDFVTEPIEEFWKE